MEETDESSIEMISSESDSDDTDEEGREKISES